MRRKTRKQRKWDKREKIRNKKLCKKYPWLKPKYGWPAKVPKDYDYSWINWYGWPNGWNKAFGDMYLEELGSAVERAGYKDSFVIEQMKEKYGQCILYCSPTNKEIDLITDKYERLSENICQICGKPDVPVLYDGYWVYTFCFDCFRDHKRNWGGENDEEKILHSYNTQCRGEEKMADSVTWKNFGDCSVTEYDISNTANKIRARWRKKNENKN